MVIPPFSHAESCMRSFSVQKLKKQHQNNSENASANNKQDGYSER